MKIKLDLEKVNSKLHWTTLYSEKILLAVIGTLTMLAAGMDIYKMVLTLDITLADLFLLFIYAEILAMVGAFYSTNRIPVTLPIIVAITALCRLIIMQTKDMDGMMVMWEAGAILVLSAAAYLMSLKDKLSLEKLKKDSEDLNG